MRLEVEPVRLEGEFPFRFVVGDPEARRGDLLPLAQGLFSLLEIGVQPLADDRFGILPVSRFEDQPPDEKDLAFAGAGDQDPPVSLLAFEPEPGEEFPSDRQGIDARWKSGRRGLCRLSRRAGSGLILLRELRIPGCMGAEGELKRVPEEFLEVFEHLVGEGAEDQRVVRHGPADLEKRRDGQGLPEKFESHRLPDRLPLFPVELLLAAFLELSPLGLHDPEPEEGRRDRLPVDAEGEEQVPPLGIGGMREIRIQGILQARPARRFFLRSAPDGVKGVFPDPFIEKIGEMIRQRADQTDTVKM